VDLGGGEAGSGTDGAVDVGDGPAAPTDDVMVVVGDPALVERHTPGRLDPPHQPGLEQAGENVVDGLGRDRPEVGADQTDDRLGRGVWLGRKGLQSRNPSGGHPEPSGS